MCGRYALKLFRQDMEAIFAVIRSLENWEPKPSYNVFPTKSMPVVRLDSQGKRELVSMRWGLLPSWCKGPKNSPQLHNARSDSVAVKPSFRSAFKQRRCLVPASGFYEWETFRPEAKQPHLIKMRSDQPFAMAGIWETWHDEQGKGIESYSIITTEPNSLIATFHDRMPVILSRDDWDEWLANTTPADELHALLRPYPESEMEEYKVSRAVNTPANDSPKCLEPEIA